MRFRGEQIQRTDAKFRLSIPAGYRRALADGGDQRLVLVRSMTGPCITAYPAGEWEEREARILSLPQSDPRVVHVMRFQVGSAAEVAPDSHGRVLLPAALRAHAGIGANVEVAVVGQIHRFELWSLQRWQEATAETVAQLSQWSGELHELGL